MNKNAWLCNLTFALSMFLLLFAGQEINEALRYSREGIQNFQLWRFLTAHIVHSNIWHGLMNILAFILILAVVGGQYSLRIWSVSYLFLCCFISSLLWLFSPSLEWYVGFSGVLHGLLALGLLASSIKGDKVHAIALVLVAGKIAREQWPGFDIGHMQDLIGVAVVVDAHLFGFIGGLLFFMHMNFLHRRFFPRDIESARE